MLDFERLKDRNKNRKDKIVKWRNYEKDIRIDF